MYVINVLICAIFNNNGEKENYMEKRLDFAATKQKTDLSQRLHRRRPDGQP